MKEKARSIMVALVAALAVASLSGNGFAADAKVRLKIPNVYWASKGAAASPTATSIPGVSFADNNPDQNTLTIVFDDTKTNLIIIEKELNAAGFSTIGEEFLSK